MDGGPVNENGRGESSPEPFDLSRLGDSLAAHSPRKCRTPESFLGPEGASLVNLDSLIPVNASAKTTNPFLSGNYGPKTEHLNFQCQTTDQMMRNNFSFSLGLSAPSATNPFQAEVPKLTLNQMSSTLSVSHGPSLPYSTSSPLPMSQQPSSLPSSLTHPTQPTVDLPGPLPEPLLPLSSVSNDGLQGAQNNQNPFLWGPRKLE